MTLTSEPLNTIDMRDKLLTRRKELTTDLHKMEKVLDQPAPRDVEDAAVERQGDEVMEALGRSEVAELQAIDRALERLDAGTYGECVKCGADIAPARLALLPATPFCRDCAG